MARLDLDRLAAARTRFGEAVIDPRQWISLMEAICAATGTHGSGLLRGEDRTPDIPVTPSVSELFESYFANNLHLGDIRAAKGLPLIASGRAVVRDQDMFSSESIMMHDPLYAHLGRFNLKWFAGLAFRSGPAVWVMTLQRTAAQGMFDDEEMRALAALTEPLTEVATLSRLVGQRALQGTLHAFEMINEPAIAMTANGIVLEANPQATRLFDDEFRVCLRRIYIRDSKASAELELLLGRHAGDGELRPGPTTPTGNVIVVRRQLKRPILIRLLPIHGPARSPFLGARTILILRDMEETRRPPVQIIAEAFSLTPAEAKVASMIAAGSSPEEIADTLELSRETVRNQIKAVFGKTNVHRQNELAALMARMT